VLVGPEWGRCYHIHAVRGRVIGGDGVENGDGLWFAVIMKLEIVMMKCGATVQTERPVVGSARMHCETQSMLARVRVRAAASSRDLVDVAPREPFHQSQTGGLQIKNFSVIKAAAAAADSLVAWQRVDEARGGKEMTHEARRTHQRRVLDTFVQDLAFGVAVEEVLFDDDVVVEGRAAAAVGADEFLSTRPRDPAMIYFVGRYRLTAGVKVRLCLDPKMLAL
jgi:hypothetical protein